VRFFATTTQARAAGFRACLRCRPDAVVNRSLIATTMIDLSRFIEQHADEPLPLSRLQSKSGFSASHLQRSFKAVLGVSPKEFQAAARLRTLKSGLRDGGGIASAVYGAGFSSASRVYEQVDGRLGMTLSAYRAGGAGQAISYVCRSSALGLLMMAATQRGVCFVQFGDDQESLLTQLEREYPNATLQRSSNQPSQQLDAWIIALDDYLSQRAPRPDLPLDLRGTAFQIQVWRFLLRIADGDVVSYSEVAIGIGSPSAVRAAASACAANRIAVLIPCHRVLCADGKLGGYRWGVERKRTLLDAERAARSRPVAA
jgi:AraC family transcriptional regulator, regulatory protein of adaptative response / methylated-DNA-[protein]-cysteine methyltransferase